MSDVRYAIRRLVSQPWLTVTATLTMAMAIGANTAILSIADAVLFRPLPYSDPDRVFVLLMQDRQSGQRFTNIPLPLLDAIASAGGVEGVTRYESGSLTMSAADGVVALRTVLVQENTFALLGVTPLRGRLFASGEARESSAARAVVLTYLAWQRYFNGRDDVAGGTVTLSGASYDVIGVLPADFVFPSPMARADVVLLDTGARSDTATFYPTVRIAPDRTRARVQAEIDAIASQLAAKSNRALPTLVEPRAALFLVGRPLMVFMLLASAALLFIGCTNISSMLAVATKLRERETGISLALGVSRARLVRISLLEGALIGLAGALVAVVVTRLSFDVLLEAVPPVFGAVRVGVDVRVATISLAAGLVAALLFSTVPTWHAARVNTVDLLRGTTDRRNRRFGHPAIVGQVAVALVLAFGGIIASKSLSVLLNVPLGFEPEQVVTIGVSPPAELKGEAPREFYVRAIDRIRAVTGVVSAGATGSPPLTGAAFDTSLLLHGEPVRASGALYALPGYFETVGIGLIRGRFLNADDLPRGAAVMSETGASALLDRQRDPIGQWVEVQGGVLLPVVGVVRDVQYSIGRNEPPHAYLVPGDSTRRMTIMAKLGSRNPEILRNLRRVMASMAPASPVTVSWWSTSINRTPAFRTPRFQTLVLGSFALLSLLLTAVGIYGLVSFLTARRKREIGVRLAVGARPTAVTRLFVTQMILPLVLGVGIGSLAIWGLTTVAASQLTGIQPNDLNALAIAVATVVSSALLATYLPAKRASRLDPVTTLRQD